MLQETEYVIDVPKVKFLLLLQLCAEGAWMV